MGCQDDISSRTRPILASNSQSHAEPSAAWRPIKTFKAGEGHKVDLWLSWGSSPLTMGMGDAFAVKDCWLQGGKWVHVYRGRPEELERSYVTHWKPSDAEVSAGPRGAPLDWWRP